MNHHSMYKPLRILGAGSWIALMAGGLMAGCSTGGKLSTNDDLEKSNAFPTERSVNCQGTEPDVVINIENWVLTDSALICQSGGSERNFYKLSSRDFNAVDSFGVRGEGPGEFLYPKIVRNAESKDFAIFDNGKCTLYIPSHRHDFYTEFQLPAHAMNSPAVVGDSAVMFVEYTSDRLALLAWDFKTNLQETVLEFTDVNGEVMKKDFAWDTDGKRIVIAHNYADRVLTGQLNGDLTLTDVKAYQGTNSPENIPYFYFDVELGENYFYLLADKNLNAECDKGGSDIEIYDYDGKPVTVIHTDIPSFLMALDEANHRILLTSATDNSIYTIDLAEGEY